MWAGLARQKNSALGFEYGAPILPSKTVLLVYGSRLRYGGVVLLTTPAAGCFSTDHHNIDRIPVF